MRALVPVLLLAACGTPDPEPEPPGESSGRCDVPATLDPDPRLVRWPYSTSVTTDSAVLSWGLQPGLSGRVEYGTDDTYGQVVEGTTTPVDGLVTPLQLFTARLTGLTPDGTICYRIVLDDGTDLTGPLKLRTAPPPDTERPVRFLVTGDYGSGLPGAAAVLEQMKAYWDDVDFWLTTGDNVYPNGAAEMWQVFQFTFYRELMRRVPYFPVPGNHDYGTGTLDPYLQSLVLPEQALQPDDQERYYAFDWGPLHVAALDSEETIERVTPDTPGDDMVDWLVQDLTAAADRPWRFAVWHHPAYMTEPGRRPKTAVATYLRPVVEAHDVQVVLTGHSHVYERFDRIRDGAKVAEGGTTYVVTGGGGAPLNEVTSDTDEPGDDHAAMLELRDFGRSVHHFLLMEVDRCHVRGQAIDFEGNVIDTFERTRC